MRIPFFVLISLSNIYRTQGLTRFTYGWAEPSSLDRRPKLLGHFLRHNDAILYSFIFDTGTSYSYIRSHPSDVEAVHREIVGSKFQLAKPGEGFKISPDDLISTDDDDSILIFGEEDSQKSLSINGQLSETIELVDIRSGNTFSYDVTFDVTDDSHHPTTGILAASRHSDFIKVSPTFVFIPWTCELILGSQIDRTLIANKFCESKEFFQVDLLPEIQGFWNILGEVQVEGHPPQQITWTVDTGAGADGTHYLSEEAFHELVHEIESTGAQVSEFMQGYKREITDCYQENMDRFPTVTISVKNSNGDRFSIDIEPQDYVTRARGYYHDSVCYLNVVPARNQWSENGARLLGLGFLDKMVSVFDHQASTISFCLVDTNI